MKPVASEQQAHDSAIGRQPAGYMLFCWTPAALTYFAIVTADTESTFSQVFSLFALLFSFGMLVYGGWLMTRGKGNRIALFFASGIAGAPFIITFLLWLVFAVLNPSNMHL